MGLQQCCPFLFSGSFVVIDAVGVACQKRPFFSIFLLHCESRNGSLSARLSLLNSSGFGLAFLEFIRVVFFLNLLVISRTELAKKTYTNVFLNLIFDNKELRINRFDDANRLIMVHLRLIQNCGSRRFHGHTMAISKGHQKLDENCVVGTGHAKIASLMLHFQSTLL